MDKIKTVKIKNEDGTVSEESYSISVDATNVDMSNGRDLQDTVGNINIDKDGNIASQLKKIDEKISVSDIIDNLNSEQSNKPLSAKQGYELNVRLNKKPYYYNTVADMKADINLKIGDIAITLGYYEVNDGGGATYKIMSSIISFSESLINNLYANLIIKDNTVNIKSIGARPLDPNTNTKYDVASYILLFQDYVNQHLEKDYTLYIPSGIWTISPITLAIQSKKYGSFNIKGDYGYIQSGSSKHWGTYITSYNASQTHLIQFGDDTHQWNGSSISGGITFGSANIEYGDGGIPQSIGLNTITNALIYFRHISQINIDFFNFEYYKGTALRAGNAWEIYIDYLNLRNAGMYATANIIFETANTSIASNSNLTAWNINYIMAEYVPGDVIEVQENSHIGDMTIGNINIETGGFFGYTDRITDFTNFDNTTATHFNTFHVYGSCEISINKITYDNLCKAYYTTSSSQIIFDRCINLDCSWRTNPKITIDGIDLPGNRKTNFDIIYCNRPESEMSQYNINYRYPMITIGAISDSQQDNKYARFNLTNFIGSLVLPDYPKMYGVLGRNNLFLSAYKFIAVGGAVINYDAQSLNDAHLVVTPTRTTLTGGMFTIKGLPAKSTLYIKAKITDGKTYTPRAYAENGGQTVTFQTLNGTGEYQWYKLINSADFTNNETYTITGPTTTDARQVWIDDFAIVPEL